MNQKTYFITWLTGILLVLSCQFAVAQPYSGAGRKPPKTLSARQLAVITVMAKHIPKDVDPFEIIAIGMVESGLTPTAISHTGDYGVLQVNCRIHRKRLKREFGVTNCEKEMMDIKTNVKAGVRIFQLFRKTYRQCRGRNTYACYNGGQGWRARMVLCIKKNACDSMKDEEAKKKCHRKCSRPLRYSKSVQRALYFVRRVHKQNPLPI